ncbi:hypothetical protein V1512DRAFT_277163 [Lipomyces arxii]|uniref:uncharacterized protein n=1 Tax=Lipomyces arxii TaxID=56418 RepID=UPI0034CD957E
MSLYLYAKMLVVGSGITGFGVYLFRTTVPTEEQVISQFSPEIRQRYLQEQKFRDSENEKDALYGLIQANANSSRPAWMVGENVEAPCVTREKDRAEWSTRALLRAQEAARNRMREERERLQSNEPTKKWW